MISLGSRPGALRNVRIGGADGRFVPWEGLCDIAIENGRILDVAPAGALRIRGDVWDAEGRWAVPGLWDHHVHMSPWSLRAARADVSATSSAAAAAAQMGGVTPNRQGVRIGVGARMAAWTDLPVQAVLDDATGSIPTYIVNADLHSVWVNAAAAARSGVTPADDGMLREQAAFDLAASLDHITPDLLDAAVGEAADAAAAMGVVGIVDFDMGWNAEPWRRRADAGFDALRVRFGTYPADLDRAIAEGLHTGAAYGAEGLITAGPLKVITDGSLGTGTAACSRPYGVMRSAGVLTVPADDLTALMLRATGSGFAIAAHAIGDVAVSVVLDGFAATGAHGSMEHAQLVGHTDLMRFARLGVAASVQPAHALDDQEVADRDWDAIDAVGYPIRSLLDAGADVRFGSDAPVAALDPWGAIADAVWRRRGDGPAWRAHEAVAVEAALAASTAGGTGTPASLLPGGPADIAVCDGDPYSGDEQDVRRMRVGATFVGGRVTHLG